MRQVVAQVCQFVGGLSGLYLIANSARKRTNGMDNMHHVAYLQAPQGPEVSS
jgi:hypothetical protein